MYPLAIILTTTLLCILAVLNIRLARKWSASCRTLPPQYYSKSAVKEHCRLHRKLHLKRQTIEVLTLLGILALLWQGDRSGAVSCALLLVSLLTLRDLPSLERGQLASKESVGLLLAAFAGSVLMGSTMAGDLGFLGHVPVRILGGLVAALGAALLLLYTRIDKLLITFGFIVIGALVLPGCWLIAFGESPRFPVIPTYLRPLQPTDVIATTEQAAAQLRSLSARALGEDAATLQALNYPLGGSLEEFEVPDDLKRSLEEYAYKEALELASTSSDVRPADWARLGELEALDLLSARTYAVLRKLGERDALVTSALPFDPLRDDLLVYAHAEARDFEPQELDRIAERALLAIPTPGALGIMPKLLRLDSLLARIKRADLREPLVTTAQASLQQTWLGYVPTGGALFAPDLGTALEARKDTYYYYDDSELLTPGPTLSSLFAITRFGLAAEYDLLGLEKALMLWSRQPELYSEPDFHLASVIALSTLKKQAEFTRQLAQPHVRSADSIKRQSSKLHTRETKIGWALERAKKYHPATLLELRFLASILFLIGLMSYVARLAPRAVAGEPPAL